MKTQASYWKSYSAGDIWCCHKSSAEISHKSLKIYKQVENWKHECLLESIDVDTGLLCSNWEIPGRKYIWMYFINLCFNPTKVLQD